MIDFFQCVYVCVLVFLWVCVIECDYVCGFGGIMVLVEV